MNEQYGFIGCGNMGGALATAVAEVIPGEQLLLCDAFAEKAQTLAQKLNADYTTDAKKLAATCRYLFLGVKPQMFDDLFAQIGDTLRARKEPPVLISMAAGLSISRVEALAGVACGVIRIMPNTPVSVGEGMILYAKNARVSDAEREAFCHALSAAGVLDELPEDKIDAASALSGCGPAFVYLFAEALADAGVECGLPRDKALLYASQTLAGAAKLLLTSGKHPGELKDAVCSPGGTTIVGVHALEENGFRAAAMNAVTAAYRRTLELKK